MDKVILITGAGEGIGFSIAEYLVNQQYQVIVTDVTLEKAEAAVAKLAVNNAFALKLDITRPVDFDAVLDWIKEKFHKLDVLINNAAMTRTTSLFEISADEFVEISRINQMGTFLACQRFGQWMAHQGQGRIVNMSSLAGQNGGIAVGAHYAISEGTILTMTKLFAKALAESGVTVNAIACGPVDSPAFHRLVQVNEIPEILKSIPVKKLGDMRFIAQTIELLIQDNSGFVTGATWDMNGGLLMR
ncbi:SDR family oxidoreductase [Acinetobacter nosocomialis]|uniref:SDR family NAD(P)-dependent oxidoreductase n=1 Tax=Acinetobacter nosocomialis TaxID=106654 RepID=UPI002740992B|nr:SDR family oxidoreductase [Acinetobacter nosocomialis]MDP7774427.1 SDR family oxidoreductase [Acinetobacter nosocomialis]